VNLQLKCKESIIDQWREEFREDPCKECVGKTLSLSVEEVLEETSAMSV
jgi:hypothetical protein